MYWNSEKLPINKKELNRIVNINNIIGENITSPFFMDDFGLRKENVKFDLTIDELNNLNKIKNSSEYFSSIFLDKLYKHQLDILDKNYKYKLFINSRHSGTSTMFIIKSLYESIFNNKNVLYYSHNNQITKNMFLSYYRMIPFYLKVGIKDIKENVIFFENNTSVNFGNEKQLVNYEIIILDDAFSYECKLEKLIISLIPLFMLNNDSEIIISSIPTSKDGYLYDFLLNNKFFKPFYVKWDHIPNRFELFKENMIRINGVERFAICYENLFESTKEYIRYVSLHKILY